MPSNQTPLRKKITEDTWSIDIRMLSRAQDLTQPHALRLTWTCRERKTASMSVSRAHTENAEWFRFETYDGTDIQINQEIYLTWTACNYGKERPWFCCPAVGCAKRAAILYFDTACKKFQCRTCCGLAYKSQRESKWDALYRKRNKYAYLLGRPRTSPHMPCPKPRYMHQSTWLHLHCLCSIYGLKALRYRLPKALL